ncbi:AHH domain-containing protein [Neisseria subflava]|uniref:AHH domain-containing protein n=2 Tax=Neisseria subflava TaxID=28449 RepID=A0A9X9N256_NEISU|nr:AHH domain-containing protein [Neisseria subflava]
MKTARYTKPTKKTTPMTQAADWQEAVWTAEYEAWGRIRNETVSDSLEVNVPFRFQGQYYDEESGLHYNRFRYYDPEIGRFVSQDPIGLQGGMNLFEYAPNPIIWVDPLGLKNYRDRFWERAGEQDKGKYQVHHIIPQDIFKKEDSGNILRCHGMDVDNLGNLIGLPRNINDHPRLGNPWFGDAQHNSDHKAYSNSVRKAIVRIGSKGSCLRQKSKLLALQKSLRRMLQKGEPIISKSGATEQQWDGVLRGY